MAKREIKFGMTVFGIVLTFFNLLLAVVFIFMTAPVAKYRIDMQKKIYEEANGIKGSKPSHQEIKDEIATLNADRHRHMDEKASQQLVRDAEISRGLQDVARLDRMIAVATDTANNNKAETATLVQSVKNTELEVESRGKEVADLTQVVTDKTAEREKVAGEVKVLTDLLAASTMSLESATAAIATQFKELQAVEDWLEANLPADRVATPKK
jgi:chromosome segregation ATPase